MCTYFRSCITNYRKRNRMYPWTPKPRTRRRHAPSGFKAVPVSRIIMNYITITLAQAIPQLLFFGILIAVSVGAVRKFRVLAGLSNDTFGLDLVLFSYGFVSDLVVGAIQGRHYWQNFPHDWEQYGVNKPVVLSMIFLLICFFGYKNMLVSKKILALGTPSGDYWRRFFLRLQTFIYGIFGAGVVILTNLIWSNTDA